VQSATEIIADAIKKCGLGNEEIAERAGVSVYTVINARKGKRTNRNTQKGIAEAVGLDPKTLGPAKSGLVLSGPALAKVQTWAADAAMQPADWLDTLITSVADYPPAERFLVEIVGRPKPHGDFETTPQAGQATPAKAGQ
jgi:transcriptional regulator with XRE-family HTH domain